MNVPRKRRSCARASTRGRPPTMSSVPVSANSYMFAHGTRPAAMPRSHVGGEVAAASASTVSATCRSRSAGERPLGDGCRGSARALRRAARVRRRAVRPPGGTAPRSGRPATRAGGRGGLRRRRARAPTTREVDRVRDERERVDGDRRVHERRARTRRASRSRLTSQDSGGHRRIRRGGLRRAERQPWRAASRERATAASSAGILAAREAGVLEPQRAVRPATAFTHMRRRGTNSAASRPEDREHREHEHPALRRVVVDVEARRTA